MKVYGEGRYPDEIDDFTFELMLGVVGEKNMHFEIKERKHMNEQRTDPKISIKDRLSKAKTAAEKTTSCNLQGKSFQNER